MYMNILLTLLIMLFLTFLQGEDDISKRTPTHRELIINDLLPLTTAFQVQFKLFECMYVIYVVFQNEYFYTNVDLKCIFSYLYTYTLNEYSHNNVLVLLYKTYEWHNCNLFPICWPRQLSLLLFSTFMVNMIFTKSCFNLLWFVFGLWHTYLWKILLLTSFCSS